ncbi:MAG: hypothetical protein ABS949_10780 [Solibacillus sp.]
MKEIFKEEPELEKRLAQYEVRVPKYKLSQKKSYYQRLIRYLASPAHNPLEPLVDSAKGYVFLKTIPLVCGILFAVLQGLVL